MNKIYQSKARGCLKGEELVDDRERLQQGWKEYFEEQLSNNDIPIETNIRYSREPTEEKGQQRS